jgi:hypothetical protein
MRDLIRFLSTVHTGSKPNLETVLAMCAVIALHKLRSNSDG